jgi:hypothetical protein
LKRRTEQRGYTFPNFSSGDFLVHGSVSLTPQDNGANLKISDTYNFDIKPWSPDNFNRNVATMISHFAADPLDFYTNWSGERGKGWAYWNGSGAYPFEFSPATITNPK